MVDPVSIAAAVVVHNFNHEGTTDAIVANEAEEPTNWSVDDIAAANESTGSTKILGSVLVRNHLGQSFYRVHDNSPVTCHHS